MYESSMRVGRQDEWGELVRLVMRTSLSVAHELGLPPEAALDCAARYLHFRDFPCLASAVQGAERAHACCDRRNGLAPADVAYLRALAARVERNRNVLACAPAMCASDLSDHVGTPAQVCEKVATAVQTLKEDVQRVFSIGNGAFGSPAVESASGFATALAAIMPADASSAAFERALGAVLRVRFDAQVRLVPAEVDHTQHQLGVDGSLTAPPLPSAPAVWMQRVKDAMHHAGRPPD
jgi:hypothetical protein